MGTPDFAVASLDALVHADCNIVGVITAPDKPAGRGMIPQHSAVKKYALEKGLKILQPEKLKNPAFLEELAALDADLQVVVAFRMLPEIVWSMPRMGTINVHASLLPQYRGAAPINWAIINGEKESGITTFKLKQEIDTGNILLQEKISIGEDETAGELHDKMKMMGAELLVKTIKLMAHGVLVEKEQPAAGSEPKHAPKIFKDDCQVNWDKPVHDVYNLIRGLSPHPAAFTRLQGKILKIFKAEKEVKAPSSAPGIVETDHKLYMKFACTDGYISVKEIQLEGKKKMQVSEFLKGYRLEH